MKEDDDNQRVSYPNRNDERVQQKISATKKKGPKRGRTGGGNVGDGGFRGCGERNRIEARIAADVNKDHGGWE